MFHKKYFLLTSLLFLTARTLTNKDTHEQVFTTIYDTAFWGTNADGEGHSGCGSVLENSKAYINFLEEFLQSHDIKTVVDAGCGDWEFSRSVHWHGADYLGYDVVASVIEKNIKRYSKEGIRFLHGNFLIENLPSADLLLCKHVLQHLPYGDIFLFLKQTKKFRYCLITNEVDSRTLSSDEYDINIGGLRLIDLTRSPFNITGNKVLHYHTGNRLHQVFLIDNTANICWTWLFENEALNGLKPVVSR